MIKNTVDKVRELLSSPSEELGKCTRFLVFQIRLWPMCIQLLRKNRAGQQAAALSYHTLFGIIPLTIVMLLIFQSFPAYQNIGDQVKQKGYKLLQLDVIKYSTTETAPDGTTTEKKINVTEQLDKFIGKYFSGTTKGSITFLSAVIVIYAAIGLLTTIERTFNQTWNVSRGRNFFQRIINYWALLTLGPLLLGLGIYFTTHNMLASKLAGSHMTYINTLTPYLISLLAFFFLYFVMPNTRVDPAAALWGAIIGSLIWAAAKWGFRIYITNVIPYSKIYGLVGLVPLTVYWIHITWRIVLFGLQVAYTTQNLTTLSAAQQAVRQREEDFYVVNDVTLVNIMRHITEAFTTGNSPITSQQVSKALTLPARFTSTLLDHLVKSGLLLATTEPVTGFVPARDPETITLADITTAVADSQKPTSDSAKVSEIFGEIDQTLRKRSLKSVIAEQPAAENQTDCN